MMILLWPKQARMVTDAELVYVDYLEVAPKNRHGPLEHRDVLGVGAALVDVAVAVSCKLVYQGRIGLHSLDPSQPFYRKRGLTEGTRDARYENLVYFELVEDGAPLCR